MRLDRRGVPALLPLVVVALLAGCAREPAAKPGAAAQAGPDLAGAWRSRVQFADGPFAAVKDLEFMFVFNAGGTMTESSNYDGAPPVPPAYGVWRRTGPGRYELHYEFYATQAPAKLEELAQGGGWMPAGGGILTETVVLSADGNAFTSTLKYEALDRAGQPTAGGGTATGTGTRIGFGREGAP